MTFFLIVQFVFVWLRLWHQLQTHRQDHLLISSLSEQITNTIRNSPLALLSVGFPLSQHYQVRWCILPAFFERNMKTGVMIGLKLWQQWNRMKWPLTKSVFPTVIKTQDVYITRRLLITLADKVNTVLLSIKQKRLKQWFDWTFRHNASLESLLELVTTLHSIWLWIKH